MMKKILIAALLIATPVFAAEKAAPKSEDAIRTVFAQFLDCIGKKDLKCIGDLCADDVTFVSPRGDGRIVRGKTGTVRGFEELLPKGAEGADLKIKHTVQNVRLIDSDHALCESSTADTPSSPKEGTVKEPDQVWFTTAIMVLKGGKWLFEDLRTYVVNPKTQPCVPVGPTPAPKESAASTPMAAGSPGATPPARAGGPPAAAEPPVRWQPPALPPTPAPPKF